MSLNENSCFKTDGNKPEQIASFSVNHNKLKKGMYISRTDGDVVTYDIRMKRPNGGDYLPYAGMHTLEHLLATYARNSEIKDSVIYIGPMGCRTGFYILLRDTVGKDEAIDFVKSAFCYISTFDGAVPGATQKECGNYMEHNLDDAKQAAKDMLIVLQKWTKEQLIYAK